MSAPPSNLVGDLGSVTLEKGCSMYKTSCHLIAKIVCYIFSVVDFSVVCFVMTAMRIKYWLNVSVENA